MGSQRVRHHLATEQLVTDTPSDLNTMFLLHDKNFGVHDLLALGYQSKDTVNLLDLPLNLKYGCLNNHAHVPCYRNKKRQNYMSEVSVYLHSPTTTTLPHSLYKEVSQHFFPVSCIYISLINIIWALLDGRWACHVDFNFTIVGYIVSGCTRVLLLPKGD